MRSHVAALFNGREGMTRGPLIWRLAVMLLLVVVHVLLFCTVAYPLVQLVSVPSDGADPVRLKALLSMMGESSLWAWAAAGAVMGIGQYWMIWIIERMMR